MVGQSMWWLAMGLELLVLVQGVRTKLIPRFPIFYSYLFFVLTQELLRYGVYRWYRDIYNNVYWVTQFCSLVLGSIVVFEIYRLGLKTFPGTAKMARNLLAIFYLVILAKAALTVPGNSQDWIANTYVRLERDLRMLQAVAILTLVILFLWYAIPVGKNLGGILLGYSAYVGMSIVQLTVVFNLGHRADAFWTVMQPASYILVLGIWAAALWSAQAEAVSSVATASEPDYDALVHSTKGMLDEAGSRLRTAVRP